MIKLSNLFLTTCLTFSIITARGSAANSEESIASFYDKEALIYDSGYSTELCKAEDMVIFGYLDFFIEQERVLDIGCGTGMLLNYFNIPNYLGVDISTEMIKHAMAKHPDHAFIVQDMESFIKEVPSESFDCIVCLFGPISYAKNPVELVNEFFRVLVPGGYLVMMPYTKRLEENFYLGGYTTATENSIKKLYYSSEMVNNLMSQTNFVDIHCKGINYFGNYVESLDATYGNFHDKAFYYRLLMKEQDVICELLPIEYARHALITARKL